MKKMEDIGVLELFVYKDERFRWVFDDADVGLAQEAFVAGMDVLIDKLTEDFENHGYDGFNFSMRAEFPVDGCSCVELVHNEALHHPLLGYSHYYSCELINRRVWLCHNLYRYVNIVPQVIWVCAKEK